MGYYKNQEIEQQVEVGDRVPAPKPATQHISFPSRRLTRGTEKRLTAYRAKQRRENLIAIAGYGLACVGVGAVIGTVIL